jgi:ATP-dependent Clp protease ATP-binding subunit ClpC
MMTGYNFTDHVRKVLRFAREHAERLHHPYVAPEHLLLGIISEGEGVATAVLASLDVKLDMLQQSVEKRVKPGENGKVGPDLPYTNTAKKVLEYAMAEAQGLHHNYLGSEHLLLGVIRSGDNPATAALAEQHVTLERARDAAARLLGSELASSPAPMIAEVPAGAALRVARRAQVIALAALVVALTALVFALRRG